MRARTIIAGLALLTATQAPAQTSDQQHFDTIERGRYLTVVGDCAACHTQPGGEPFAGGRAIETPFGTILASNITPDRQTGIGGWTDQEFVDTLQKGRGRDGKHIYPAMPYTYYARVSRDDALAIRSYLATMPAVDHAVTENQLPFPFDIRASLAAWNQLFFTKGGFRPNPARDAEWNRGAYLVTGLAHCGMCHTAKNVAGGDDASHALQGAKLQGWTAPDITNDARTGLGAWSIDDITDYLRTGHNRFAAATGPMAEEVAQSSSAMSAADLRAIAVYLKSQPGEGRKLTPVAADGPSMRVGREIYADECSACHTPNGAGIPGLFPALAGGPGVQSDEPASILRVILQGARSVGTVGAPTAPAMPSFAWQLTDAQIAAVATYVRNAWGNAAPEIDANQVSRARADLKLQ